MQANYIKSEKGNKKLIHLGHAYMKDKKVESRIYWKCDLIKELKCKARAITCDDLIIKLSGRHNHGGDTAKIEASEVTESIREDAKNSVNSPHVIVSSASMNLNPAVAAKMPSVCNLKRTIRNIRCKEKGHPVSPSSTSELILPEEFKLTCQGSLFLLYDSGQSIERMIIFATERNLTLLSRSTRWLGD